MLKPTQRDVGLQEVPTREAGGDGFRGETVSQPEDRPQVLREFWAPRAPELQPPGTSAQLALAPLAESTSCVHNGRGALWCFAWVLGSEPGVLYH